MAEKDTGPSGEAFWRHLAGLILPLPDRAITAHQVEKKTWEIWSYCRLHRDSLDSERHCKGIADIIRGAVAEVQVRLDSAIGETDRLTGIAKGLRKEVKTVTAAAAAKGETIEGLRKELRALNRKLDRLAAKEEKKEEKKEKEPELAVVE